MAPVNLLIPEIIKICRPLIFSHEQLLELVDVFTARWDVILGNKRRSNDTVPTVIVTNDSDSAVALMDECVSNYTSNQDESSLNYSGANKFEEDNSMSNRPSCGKAIGFSIGRRSSGQSSCCRNKEDEARESINSDSKLNQVFFETQKEEVIAEIQNETPLYTLIDVAIPTGTEEGKFLGLGVNQEIIDIALVTTYGGGDYASKTASYPGTLWRFLPVNVADALKDFVTSNNLQETNIAMTLAAYTTGMPDFFLVELKEKMAKFPELNNVFIVEKVLSNACGLAFAARFESRNTKFAMTLGEKIEVCLIKKVFNKSGKKRRSVFLIDGSDIFQPSTIESLRTEMDDPKLPGEDLSSTIGIPRLAQNYLIEAIKQTKILKGKITEQLKERGAIKFEDLIWVGRSNDGEDGQDDPYQRTKLFLQRLGYKHSTDHDCVQVEFIIRAIYRRSCYILGACAVALALIVQLKSVTIVISGPLLYFPNYAYYMRKVVLELVPEDRQIHLEDRGRNSACVGAALYTASEAEALIKKLDGRRRLPPFHLKTCCLDPKTKCGCKEKWS